MTTKQKISLISGILFWGPMIYLGYLYGWRLPVLLFLVFLSVEMHKANK